MSGFARKPVKSSRAFDAPSRAEPRAFFDVANEKHYSVVELAKLWALSERTIRWMVESEPGVLCWGSSERRFKVGYKTLRIPETVMLRVHRRLRIAS